MSNTMDPETVRIETERLIIRPPRQGDGQEHFAAVLETLDDLRKPSAALPWAQEEPSEQQSEQYCNWAAKEFIAKREFALLYLCRETEKIVGASGLHSSDWSIPSFEIGWWGRKGFQGRGLFAEGADAVITWGFETLAARRIYAEVDDRNAQSWRLCERIGMKHEGLARNARAAQDGTLCDVRIYASIR